MSIAQGYTFVEPAIYLNANLNYFFSCLCSSRNAGVPDIQEDHAPRMARFAASCQIKMGQLIANKLTDRLGKDTANLRLRVGMHSGPITGGILRGDKGRFQLFGDVSLYYL